MDYVKNRGRNKFSACFNPTVVDEDGPCFQSPPSPAGVSRRRKKTGHRSLYAFVKAVFFKTPLLKKLRGKRSKRDPYRPGNNTSSSKTKTQTRTKKSQDFSDPDEFFRVSSDRSSIFSSSSRASSISSNSSSGIIINASSDDGACLDSYRMSTNNIRHHAMKLISSSSRCDCRGFMFIVSVCLLALVFSGKACAVVACTTAWLFLVPGRAGPRGGPLADDEVLGSEEYKKKVIMEGLLERNVRSRRVVYY